MWELYTGTRPYNDLTPFQIMYKVVQEQLRPPILEECPAQYRQIIEDCTQQKAAQRCTFKEVIQHLENMQAILLPQQ